MKCFALSVSLVACCGTAQAQHWEDTGIPHGVLDTWMSYADTVHDALYFSGVGYIYVDSITYTPLFRFQDGQWDTLGYFGNAINSAIVYHDTLLVGGAFHTACGVDVQGVACYADGAWQPYGTFGLAGEAIVIYELRLLNGDLYAVGVFSHADGHLCNGVAKRVGGHWENVGDLSGFTQAPIIADMALYQGQLVVSGIFHNADNTLKNVMQFDGATWEAMGPGILGGDAGGMALANYQGNLYLGGIFYQNAGNAGQSIMRWDGSQWHTVGHLQVNDNSDQYAASVYSLAVHDGLLFAGGSYYFADHVPVQNISTWDGTKWCGLGGTLDPNVRTMSFYHDTLYVGCGNTADGEVVNGAAKFIGSTFQETCSTVGIEETPKPNEAFRVASQESGVVSLLGLADGPHEVRIYDPQGRLVVQKQTHSNAGRSDNLYLGDQPSALYIIVVDATQVTKWVPVR